MMAGGSAKKLRRHLRRRAQSSMAEEIPFVPKARNSAVASPLMFIITWSGSVP
jgi:hypothetical protein